MTEPERPRRPWRDVAATFLRLGVTSYGDPAIMGIMQAELQEKRAWVSRERFLEGLSLVNMLPGATATQLAIFIGLGLTAARTTPQAIICLLALVTAVATPLGIATILVLAGAAGLLIFHPEACEPSLSCRWWLVSPCYRSPGAPHHGRPRSGNPPSRVGWRSAT
jgi:chromate transport protein ChrA